MKREPLTVVAFGFEFLRGGVVGREEHFERRAVLDLGVELAGCAEGGDQFVPGVFLEIGRDGLDRRREVGRDGDLDFVRLGRTEGEHSDQACKAGGGKT